MKQHKFVLWSATGIAAIALATFGIVNGIKGQSDQTSRIEHEARTRAVENCRSGNEIRASLLGVLNDLRPAGSIRRPGETDDQYDFRQKQSADAYKLLAERLAPRQC